jgi:UDP-glucose 4-epimerase
MRVLLTGGAGYIGSHVAVCLLGAGHDVTILDDFSNSRPDVLDRIKAICGCQPALVAGDVRDAPSLLTDAFDAVVHLAGSKSIAESNEKPLSYYDNNIAGVLGLLRAMQAWPARRLLFSSSATVYGDPEQTPLTESAPLQATNPYGRAKLFIEDMLRDIHRADPSFGITILRYFNPAGAHESGLIGENSRDWPDSLMPRAAAVAAGEAPCLSVFGGDYPTPDGTGVRDFIHVMDLAEGHLAAVDHLAGHGGLHVFNLGTGVGCSVLDLVRSFSAVIGRPLPHTVVGRRPGDAATSVTDPGLANRVLGWRAKRGLREMCEDAWRWQCNRVKTPAGS